MTEEAPPLTFWAIKILEHARNNYEADGWDAIYECTTLDEMTEQLRESSATTYREALKYIHEGAKAYQDRRDEIRAEIF